MDEKYEVLREYFYKHEGLYFEIIIHQIIPFESEPQLFAQSNHQPTY